MAKRLIDLDALIQQVRLMANRASLGEIRPSNISGIEVCGLILNAPTVDAVEVVRCRDCKHCRINGFAEMSGMGFCKLTESGVRQDDFCSYGERKEG